MKIEEIGESHINVISALNSQGTAILYIDKELFAIREFIPSDKNIPKTMIQGMNITKLISNHLLGNAITPQQQQTLMNQVTGAQVERREYSPHFSWIMYS
jgi:hypothetical protein